MAGRSGVSRSRQDPTSRWEDGISRFPSGDIRHPVKMFQQFQATFLIPHSARLIGEAQRAGELYGLVDMAAMRFPRNADITPAGKLLGLIPAETTQSGSPVSPQIQVVHNWFEELKRLVPVH